MNVAEPPKPPKSREDRPEYDTTTSEIVSSTPETVMINDEISHTTRVAFILKEGSQQQKHYQEPHQQNWHHEHYQQQEQQPQPLPQPHETKKIRRWLDSPLTIAGIDTPSTSATTLMPATPMSTSGFFTHSSSRNNYPSVNCRNGDHLHLPMYEEESPMINPYESNRYSDDRNAKMNLRVDRDAVTRTPTETPDNSCRARALFRDAENAGEKNGQRFLVETNEDDIGDQAEFMNFSSTVTSPISDNNSYLQTPFKSSDNAKRTLRNFEPDASTDIPDTVTPSFGISERRRSSSNCRSRSPISEFEKTPSEFQTPEVKSRHWRSPNAPRFPDYDFSHKTSLGNQDFLFFKSRLFCRVKTNALIWILCLFGMISTFTLIKINKFLITDSQMDDPSFDVLIADLDVQKATTNINSSVKPFQRPAGGLKGVLVHSVGDEYLHKLKQQEGALVGIANDEGVTTRVLTSEGLLQFSVPSNWNKNNNRKFDRQDAKMYNRRDDATKGKEISRKNNNSGARVLVLHDSARGINPNRIERKVLLHPAEFTDNTQLYSVLDSDDERLDKMEMREPYVKDECVPMQPWQTTFHPSCNGVHEIGFNYFGKDRDGSIQLFGTKGFWRHAWKYEMGSTESDVDHNSVVLKTLKYQHNFEDAHFEHDRVDAIAMEKLTSSPHVVNIYGFCGHSVTTEFANGPRLGELADKSSKKPLVRINIAQDIANGLADVHGINGDAKNNATFVHLDINPSNVLSVGGTLKLNDFNIGILRKWNTTSNKPCGFPAQYPNPQWRSPEEARNEDNLTEKVDVFSMGHIFFRLICGHEPWNKLQPGGKPSKTEISKFVEKGVLPYIPEKVTTSTDLEVIAIRDAMLKCYTYDPQKRPSAREISAFLKSSIDHIVESRKMKTS